MEFELQHAYLVTGRVIDEETGEPIEGASLYISETPARGNERIPPTDKDGYYRLRVLPGKTRVYGASRPEPYVFGGYGAESREVVVTDADATFADIALKKGVTREGMVVDDEGKPVASAQLFHTAGEHSFHSPTYADGDGKFRLPRLDPDKQFTIRAREGDRMTKAPVPVNPKDTGPIKLVIQEGNGVKLRVRVLDDGGKPIAGAKVAGYWQTERTGSYPALGETDAEGRCESKALWPEGTYSITVTAKGYAKVQTDRWQSVAGETHDFGDVVMTAAKGFAGGRVLDADGKPVPGAKVYNKGDGPQAVEVSTDEQGRFRLEGLYPGHAYVFAEKGDLFGGARAEVGKEDATVTVTPEPTGAKLGTPGKAVSLTSPETDRRIAQELILQALETPRGKDDKYYTGNLIASLAICDPDKAFELSARRDGKHDEAIMRALGKHLLLESPEEALGYLASIGNARSRLYAMLEAARKLTPTNPDKAREVLESIVPEAYGLSAPKYEAAFLASCGEALYKLDPKAAEPVIRKAESMAKTLPNSEWDAYARGCAAEALCHIDLEGALALIADLTGDYQPTRHQPNIAARIAATKPDKAAELMKVLDGSNYGRKMPRVVYNMAFAHPDKALALVETIKGQQPYREEQSKARSLAFIALALRENDPERASEVFEKAVTMLHKTKLDPSYGSYGAAELASTMGELAVIGLQIGYPDVERIAWRAISLRPAPSQQAWDDYNQQGGQYIKNLAFASPELARDLVQDTVERALRQTSEGHSDLRDNLAVAAALVDANLAAEFVRGLPEDKPEDKTAWTLRLYSSVVKYLLMRPEDRYVEAMGRYGKWVPGADVD